MTGDIDKVIAVSSLIGTLVIGGAWLDAFMDMSKMAELMIELEHERDAAFRVSNRKEAALQAALRELMKTRHNLQRVGMVKSANCPVREINDEGLQEACRESEAADQCEP